MNFPREVNITKDSIGSYQVTFTVNPSLPDTGTLEVQIVGSNNKEITREYDLTERLKDDAPGLVHLSNLISLRDYLNIRLPAEVLPTP